MTRRTLPALAVILALAGIWWLIPRNHQAATAGGNAPRQAHPPTEEGIQNLEAPAPGPDPGTGTRGVAEVASVGTRRADLAVTAKAGQGTFRVHGSVVGLDAIDAEDCEPRILCQRRWFGAFRTDSTAEVHADGTWEAEELAAGTDWRFVLTGEPIVPSAVTLAAPRAGESHEIQHVAVRGNQVWFVVIDADSDEELPGAEVTAFWSVDGERLQYRERTGENGYVRMDSIPTGSIEAIGQFDGYAPMHVGPVWIPQEPPHSNPIYLSRAASVRGTCLYLGQPLPDFQITFWRAALQSAAVSQDFRNRADGSFELELPLGKVRLSAAAPGLPPSEPIALEVPESGLEDVVLEIGRALTGRGRVVDARTGEALSEAQITLYQVDQNSPVQPVGPAMRVRADGTFEFDRFRAGANLLEFTAPGYSTLRHEVDLSPEGEAQVGDVALYPSQDLAIVVRSAVLDVTGIEVELLGTKNRPGLYPSPSGEVVVPDWNAGRSKMRLWDGDKLFLEQNIYLRPGQPWRVEVDLPARTLIVHVQDPDPIPAGYELVARFPSRGGFDVNRRALIPPDGEVRIDGVASGSVELWVYDPSGSRLTQRMAEVSESGSEVWLPLAETVYPLRVVDSDGEPVPECSVTLTAPGFAGGQMEFTDTDGRCSFRGMSPGTYTLRMECAARGATPPMDFQLTDEPGVRTLVFNPTASVYLRLLEGTEPAAGLLCLLMDLSRSAYVANRRSSATGEVRFEGISDGKYIARVDDAKFFPSELVVAATANPQLQTMQVRRRASLVLLVTSPSSGLPIPDLAIDLSVHGLEGNLATWVANHVVSAPPQGLRTDASGHLALEDVPSGEWSWSAQLPDGTALSGSFVLPPEKTTRVVVP